MPPLNIAKESKHYYASIQSDTNNNRTDTIKKPVDVDEEDVISKEFGYFVVRKPIKTDKNVRYIYIDDSKYGLVWPNIIAFTILHIYYVYALHRLAFNPSYKTWFFRNYSCSLLLLKHI